MDRIRDLTTVPRYVHGELRQVDPALMAAAVAFNAFLALVPTAIALLALVGIVGRSDDVLATTKDTLAAYVPADVADFLLSVVEDAEQAVSAQQGAVVIVVSILVALYAGSRGVFAMQKALRRLEGIGEDRSRPLVRLIGIGLTIGGAVTFVLATLALLVGSQVVEFFVDLTGIGLLDTLWTWASAPLAVIALYAFLWALYRWGPPRPLPVTWAAALAATVAAVLASSALGWYLGAVGVTSGYAVLGTFALTLLWLYVLAYAVLYSAGLVVFGWSRGRRELAALKLGAPTRT